MTTRSEMAPNSAAESDAFQSALLGRALTARLAANVRLRYPQEGKDAKDLREG